MKYRSAIQLLRKYISGTASHEEKAQAEKWYEAADNNDIQNDKKPDEVKEQIYQRILTAIENETPVIPFYKKSIFRITAAAAFILFIAGTYIFFQQNKTGQNNNVAAQRSIKNDIAPPANNKATLTLADGTKISIDSAGKGVFAVQGAVHVLKQEDGQIVYNGNATDEITYNTLSVPKGSKPLSLVLADGSQVWLNVSSSITYPTAFSGTERKVVITGEAYFEVAKNAAMPFIVKQANNYMQVKVLGTHFNVNTYDDEAAMKITLLEGAVDVSVSEDHLLLKPGQQAQVSNTAMKKFDDINLNEVMAWKNGAFYFDGADIKTIMRQVEKWYNVNIIYEDNINYSFVANISRDVNASQLFKILELTDLVHFKIEGNKVTVMK